MTSPATRIAAAPIESLDPSRAEWFADGAILPLMARLRQEAPLHYCADSAHGPYWSVTRHADIMAIELQPNLFSSSHLHGGVSLLNSNAEMQYVTFVQMDPPDHTPRRKAVASAFDPSEMNRLADDLRQRTSDLLDRLPRDRVFDWTHEVAVRLTTDMLAIMFDFPWEDRDKIADWSEWLTSAEAARDHPAERNAKIQEMATYFFGLWQARTANPEAADLLSRMIRSPALGAMDPVEFMGSLVALVVGGTDTTRNTMSGLVIANAQFPEAWEKVIADPGLATNTVSEIIRWQTPATHMRRVATEDVDFGGVHIRKGDAVIMWYVSANRDEAVFPDADRFMPDRPNARRHLAFGHGIHRCVGARLSELQLEVLISEMARRQMRIDIVGPVVRDPNCFLSTIKSVPVRITNG